MNPRRLLLVRHAEAEHRFGGGDHTRALTGTGREQAAQAGRRIAAEGLLPDYVLCSSARRTRETWELLQAELAREPGVDVSDSLYLSGPDEVLDLIGEIPPEVETLLVMGHNPAMGQLAAAFPTPDDPDGGGPHSFPPGGVALVDVELEWRYLAPGTGTVRMLEP